MSETPQSSSYAVSRRVSTLIFPGIILMVGILLTLWIQKFSIGGVVFSGDGGLKALLAQQISQQISTGSFPLDMSLRLPAGAGADWINALWQEGLYPFTPPFVYEVGLQHFITFPFTFPLMTAPFHALFGDRGLYLIPMVALWVTWARFWQIGLRTELDAVALCVGLVTLIFASPLSLYGGMYWEHTLAVALAFWGVTALLFPKASSGNSSVSSAVSGYRVLVSGVLIGLSVWFRPEMLCLVVGVSGLAIASGCFPRWRLSPRLTAAKVGIFVGAIACTIGIFFALNYGVYGHPLGIHAIQIVEESTTATQLAQAKDGYQQLLPALLKYFPAVIFIGLALFCGPEFKKEYLKTTNRFKGFKTPNAEVIGIVRPTESAPIAARFLLALSLLFVLSAPLILPPGGGGKQWGPRFYLIVMPMLSWVVAEQLRAGFFQPWARRVALLGAAAMLAFGIHTNIINGAFKIFDENRPVKSISLPANYEPIAPAIAYLQEQPSPWIAMSHQYVAQQLWLALPDKVFFRTESLDEVQQLATVLAEQNESEFIYVCYPEAGKCPDDKGLPNMLSLENGGTMAVKSLGYYGKYLTYKVGIAS